MRVGRQHSRRSSVRTPSVQHDWYACLPPRKAQVYSALTERLNTAYNIFSVALNEAFELRRVGRLTISAETLSVIPGLCNRLADPLAGLLHALGDHARHYGTVPNAAPLNPSDFQGARGQRTARMNDLFSRVLLSQRSQFLHKIAALEEMVAYLEEEFREAAEDIGLGACVRAEAQWRQADTAHYDLNTCLREAEILLKSFLVTLPEEQLGVFQQAVSSQMRVPERPNRTQPQVPPRRMAATAGR